MTKKKTKHAKISKISKTSNQIQKYKDNMFWIVAVIIATGCLLRLVIVLVNPGLWHDECALAINILDREYWGLFNPLRFLQVAPPLFLCAVKFFTEIISLQDNIQLVDFILRVVPLSAGIISIFAFYYLLKIIFVKKYVILSGLVLFALNPLLITYSYELKPYSTDVLVAIVLMIYFLKYNADSYHKIFLHILCLSFGVMFSLPAVFIIFGGLMLILFSDYKKFLYAFTAFSLFMAFYFVYHCWGVMEAHGIGMDKYWATAFVTPYNILSITTGYIKSSFNIFVQSFLTLCVIAVGFVVSFLRDRKVFIFSFSIIIAILTASYLHLYPIAPRMLLFMTPILIILICEFLNLFPSENQMSAVKILPFIFTILAGYFLYNSWGIINFKIFTDTDNLITTFAQTSINEKYSVIIPKNSNVEWIYYSRFFNFDNDKIYFQEWNTKDNDWLKTIPARKYYYFAPYETEIPKVIMKIIPPPRIIKLGKNGGFVLKID